MQLQNSRRLAPITSFKVYGVSWFCIDATWCHSSRSTELTFGLALNYAFTADLLAADLPVLGRPLPFIFQFRILPKVWNFLFILCMACLVGTRMLREFCHSLWTAEEKGLPDLRSCPVINVLSRVENCLYDFASPKPITGVMLCEALAEDVPLWYPRTDLNLDI